MEDLDLDDLEYFTAHTVNEIFGSTISYIEFTNVF